MKLKHLDRTFFEINPIEEVIAQIRFPRNLEIESGLPVNFQKEISKEFPLMEVQENHSVSVKLGSSPEKDQLNRTSNVPIFNFLNESRDLRVSLTNNFLALTSNNYESWESFYPKLEAIYKKLISIYSVPIITRLGVRYRNLIDKEKLGLKDDNWSTLINPYIIGHLSHSNLFEGEITEENLIGANSITQINLDEFSLILQTGFADKDSRMCFYIDADHYNEFNLKVSDFKIKDEFEVLHGKSSSVFGNCIETKLFQSLKPIKKV